MGVSFTCAHAATLVSQLPPQSRLMVARDGTREWGDDTYLLSHIEHDLRVLAWQRTEDAQKRRNYPEHIETPHDREVRKREDASSTPEFMAYVADAVGIPEDRR